MSSRVVLVLASALLLDGCVLYGREVRSVPTLGAEAAVIQDCPKDPGAVHWPPSAGQLCFSIQGIEVQVEAGNQVTTFAAIGPLLPLIPFYPRWFLNESCGSLEIEIWFKAPDGYGFSPWQVSLQTDQGEIIRVSEAHTNFRVTTNSAGTVETVRMGDIDPSDRRPHPASDRYFLTFDKHVAPDQTFSLTIQLVAPDGGNLKLPTIMFRKGRLSYLASTR